MTDTPPTPPTFPPPSKLDLIKTTVGDLARPFAMYSIAATTAAAIILPSVDAGKLTAAGLLLGALFGVKTFENNNTATQAAKVEIAKANAPAA